MLILHRARRVVIVSLCLALLAFFGLSGVLPWKTQHHVAFAAPLTSAAVNQPYALTCPPPLPWYLCIHIEEQPNADPSGGCPQCNAIFDPRSATILPGDPYLLSFTNTMVVQELILDSTGAVVAAVNPRSSVIIQVPSQPGVYLYRLAGSLAGNQATLQVTVGQTAG